ncbi:MAG: hypothetical protein DRP45_00720 [Candidatus Zixiibacteriota bacterium]|nr:MAG: hypothetical protein DRP45_00720 [candidate division Zixibacteria bacterium]
MAEKFELLDRKVKQVLQQLDGLKDDNTILRKENRQLQTQLTELKSDFDNLKLNHNDQSELIKTKLISMLTRIEELEKIGL